MGTKATVAVLVLIISNHLPNLAFFVLIDPSGAFPEAYLTYGGCAGGIDLQFLSHRW